MEEKRGLRNGRATGHVPCRVFPPLVAGFSCPRRCLSQDRQVPIVPLTHPVTASPLPNHPSAPPRRAPTTSPAVNALGSVPSAVSDSTLASELPSPRSVSITCQQCNP